MPQDQATVSLREITAQTVGPVMRLSVAESQKGFVATNAVSLAQALFAPEAWYRAIYSGEELVGFVMLEDQSPHYRAFTQQLTQLASAFDDEQIQAFLKHYLF